MPRLSVLSFTCFVLISFCDVLSVSAQQTDLATKIVLSEPGFFRGHQWGESKKQIKLKEKLSLQSENDTLLGYVLHLEDSTLVDVQYLFDSIGTTKKFVLGFVAPEDAQEKILQENFIAYYNQKFGSPIFQGEGNKRWNSKQGYIVDLRNIKDESGSGTEIIYSRP